jgi:hypothetical protein
MFDVMAPNASVYHTLINANLNDNYNSSLFLKSSGRVGISDNTFNDRNTPNDTYKDDTWYRFVFTVKFSKEGGFYNFYWNGELLQENLIQKDLDILDNARHTLDPAEVRLFYDAPPEEGGNSSVDDNDIYVAEIAIWDRALTTAEVALLGMFDIDE